MEYYFCMESTNAAKGGSADYNIDFLLSETSGIADALAMPETSAVADALASMACDSALQNSLLA